MAPATLADLFSAVTTDTTQITTDQAAVVADQAKLTADQAAVTSEQTQLTTDQATFSSALGETGPGAIVNSDGSVTILASSSVAPGYTETNYPSLASLLIPTPPAPAPVPTPAPSS